MDSIGFAERILALRKASGISQEELAAGIGVSRQAVSKWEGAQSVPDVDKIMQLSEYFGVTTDYLLKGTASRGEQQTLNADTHRCTAMTMFYIATAINIIGVAASFARWYTCYDAYSVGIGIAVTAVGTGVFLAGLTIFRTDLKKALRYFFIVNVWPVLLNPYGMIANYLDSSGIGGYTYHPAPVPVNMDKKAFWIPYILICLAADTAVIIKGRERK